MKQLLSLFLFLVPCLAWAQYPSNGNQKITLGEQTTADGLVYRGVAATDTVRKPSIDTMAYMVLDTTTNIMWHYKKATSNAWLRLNLLPSDTAAIAYVNTYGAQTVNGVKNFTDTIIVNKGIRFPATQSASTNVNTLDDYEEGTWTTTFGGQSNLTGTPILNGAIYRKIGSNVYIEGNISGLSITTTATRTTIVFTVPINMHNNTSYQVGNVFAFRFPTDNIGLIVDADSANKTDVGLVIPSNQTTISGSISNGISFSMMYVAEN
jgi:hypothetical protein